MPGIFHSLSAGHSAPARCGSPQAPVLRVEGGEGIRVGLAHSHARGLVQVPHCQVAQPVAGRAELAGLSDAFVNVRLQYPSIHDAAASTALETICFERDVAESSSDPNWVSTSSVVQ